MHVCLFRSVLHGAGASALGALGTEAEEKHQPGTCAIHLEPELRNRVARDCIKLSTCAPIDLDARSLFFHHYVLLGGQGAGTGSAESDPDQAQRQDYQAAG